MYLANTSFSRETTPSFDISTTTGSENSTFDTNETSLNKNLPKPSTPYQTPDVLVAINWSIPVFALMCYFGNTMIILVMCNKKNRRLASSIFFIALAVSDIVLFSQINIMQLGVSS